MNFYENEGYVTPNLMTDNPADEIAHYLSYMTKPSSKLIELLRKNGYLVTNQKTMMESIIKFMAESDHNVDTILQHHPHYNFFQEGISEDIRFHQTNLLETNPKNDSQQLNLFELKINGVFVLFFLTIIFLVIKIVQSLTKAK